MTIWKDAISIAKDMYVLCSDIPSVEKYSLISQIQRASVSIAANIAEGSGRTSNIEFKRFLDISIASAYELETLLNITKEVGYIDSVKFDVSIENVQRIQKMIFNFKRQLV